MLSLACSFLLNVQRTSCRAFFKCSSSPSLYCHVSTLTGTICECLLFDIMRGEDVIRAYFCSWTLSTSPAVSITTITPCALLQDRLAVSGHKREWKVATRGAGALVGEMAPLQVIVGP